MTLDFRDLRTGDAVPSAPAQDRCLVSPGQARWHALTVRPQREDAVEAWLAQRGVKGFHPVTRRHVMRFGRQVEAVRCYLPGYVFARFPGTVLRHRVAACQMVTGAVTLCSGEWGCLDPYGLRAIIAMRKVDHARRSAEQRMRRAARRLSPGDRAVVIGGLFGEARVEVVSIEAGEVRFRVAMFGGDVLATATADQMVKIAA